MITIRLSRTGKHKAPQYRIVVQERMRDPWSPAIEVLGHYNPRRNPIELVLNKERAEYWLKQGAQPSGTLHNLFVDQGLIKSEKQKSVNISKKHQARLDAKKTEAEKSKREAEEKVLKEKAAHEEAQRAEAEAKRAEEEAKRVAETTPPTETVSTPEIPEAPTETV